MRITPSQPNKAARRIGILANLPVFLDLKDKPVLVAGGSAGAAWKAELLASCGAEVHVFCPSEELSDDFRDLLACMPLIHRDQTWSGADFHGMAIAVGDCAGDEAELFHATAKAAGVPANVIDRPEFCDFKFGSVVNRSPVVIGISTDGAAPILGQAIRQRIETLLAPSLASWAALAQRLRPHVSARLAQSSQRRAFWEKFVDLCFGGDEPAMGVLDDLFRADAISQAGRTSRKGRVTVVGTGAGEADLLTIRAVRALQAADLILFEEPVSEDILQLARREARRIPIMGDRGGPHGATENVGGMIARLACSGRNIVWLAAGDLSGHVLADAIGVLEPQGIEVRVLPVAGDESALNGPSEPTMPARLPSPPETVMPMASPVR
jgi:uroporphyrin-III C-methyltransferase/precorrin-2 dehydrogenase/sirohydrochlorin ferrochelatase